MVTASPGGPGGCGLTWDFVWRLNGDDLYTITVGTSEEGWSEQEDLNEWAWIGSRTVEWRPPGSTWSVRSPRRFRPDFESIRLATREHVPVAAGSRGSVVAVRRRLFFLLKSGGPWQPTARAGAAISHGASRFRQTGSPIHDRRLLNSAWQGRFASDSTRSVQSF
jgi:hypothetical protein